MDHDFEDIKRDAPLIRKAQLQRRRKKPMIGTGFMSDPYMHLEESLGYARRCLQVTHGCGFGVSILTQGS